MKLLLFYSICLSVLTATIKSTNAVSFNPELYDKITELSYDFGTEQSKDHYDKKEHESESSQEDVEASCYVENYVEYKHGQKVSRTDPCVTCVCMDGEIFCWWKKCGHQKLLNENKKHKNNNNKLLSSFSNHKKQKINKEKRRKKLKLSRKNLRKFNHSINQNYQNDNETQYSTDSSSSSLSQESNNDSFLLTKINNNNRNATVLPLINLKFNKSLSSFKLKKTKKNNKEKNDKIKLSPKIIRTENSKSENYDDVDVDGNDDDSDDYLENEELIISESSKTQQRVTIKTNDKKDNDNNISLPKQYIITTSDNTEENDDVPNKNDILERQDTILTSENVLSKFENPYAITDNIDSVMNNKKKIKFINTSENEKMNKISTIISHLNLKHTDVAEQQQQEQSQQKNLNENQIKSTKIDKTIEEHCIVMGKLYRIGTVLPQDTGNCLQCICIEGATKDELPRVTCSPHNCPPLILPDLFDTTGY